MGNLTHTHIYIYIYICIHIYIYIANWYPKTLPWQQLLPHSSVFAFPGVQLQSRYFKLSYLHWSCTCDLVFCPPGKERGQCRGRGHCGKSVWWVFAVWMNWLSGWKSFVSVLVTITSSTVNANTNHSWLQRKAPAEAEEESDGLDDLPVRDWFSVTKEGVCCAGSASYQTCNWPQVSCRSGSPLPFFLPKLVQMCALLAWLLSCCIPSGNLT